ncbi:Zinc finger and BTB domain-containing protein 8B [Armadillidium vulgare]|nr:Zinc finger and BTB domain-containing protein 8B [Armadillidium vulgare]
MNIVCKILYDYLFIRLNFSPSLFFSNLFEYHFDGEERDETYQKEVMNHYTFNVFYRFETFSDCFLFLNVYNTFYAKLLQYKVPRLGIEKCFVPITYCNECVCFRGIDAADTFENNNAIEKYVKNILQPRIIGGGGGGGGGESFNNKNIKRKKSGKIMMMMMMEKLTLFKKRAPIINLDPDSALKVFDFCHSNEYSISPRLKVPATLLFLKNNFPIKTLKYISGKIYNSILGGWQEFGSSVVGNRELLNVDPETLEVDTDSKHKCPFCDYKSKFKPHVRRHIMFKHTKERPFGCVSCEKRFTNKESLQRHPSHRRKTVSVCELFDAI